MKQNKLFILSEVAGEHILVPAGKAVLDFNFIVSLNDMGVVIWKWLENDMTKEQLVGKILAEYNTTLETANIAVDTFLNQLREAGCLEE